MSMLSEAEKRVFGEHAFRDEAGNIVEKAIGFVKKETQKFVRLTEDEFAILVEKAKAWDAHVDQKEASHPVVAAIEPVRPVGESSDAEEHF